jgi:hypothetical protein
MTNTATKTYLVSVIERAIAYYKVEADDARTAAENWQDGEFYTRDDEALESEGPNNVRERQADGKWRKVPPSEWEAEPPIDGPTILAALEALADQADEDCPAEHRSRHFTEALETARDIIAKTKKA